MTEQPVSEERIQIAEDFGLMNVNYAAVACRTAGLPFYAACALLEKESHGRNIWGHDNETGVPGQNVTALNFVQAYYRILNGAPSNGVGPCQITWAGSLKNGHRDGGFFQQMLEQNLAPWNPGDNMLFGFKKLAEYKAKGTWASAGMSYNGSQLYGNDLAEKVAAWHQRLR